MEKQKVIKIGLDVLKYIITLAIGALGGQVCL